MDFIEIIKSLYAIPSGLDYGYSEEEIVRAENKLRIRFPEVLRNFYLKLGKHDIIIGEFSSIRLLKFYEFKEKESLSNLTFASDEDELFFIRINKNDTDAENPAVYKHAYNRNETILFSKTMDNFFLFMACWNGIHHGFKYSTGGVIKIHGERRNKMYYMENNVRNIMMDVLVKIIENNWKEVPGLYSGHFRIFTNEYMEVIILTYDIKSKAFWFGAGSNYKERFNRIIEIIPFN